MKNSGRTVLVTGAKGFIGSCLRGYIGRSHPKARVFSLDRSALAREGIHRCDLTRTDQIHRFLRRHRPCLIFHCCGDTVSTDMGALLRAHAATTVSLFCAIHRIRGYHPRVIIPSTAAEYGRVRQNRPIPETTAPDPASTYAISKTLQTSLALLAARSSGIDVVIARIFNITGTGVPPTLFIGRFAVALTRIRQGLDKPVLHTQSLAALRDCLDTTDVCRYLWALARKGKRGEVYNVCRGAAFPVKWYLRILQHIAGIPKLTVHEDQPYLRQFNIPYSCGSVRKLRAVTGLSPAISLHESLTRTLRSYQKPRH